MRERILYALLVIGAAGSLGAHCNLSQQTTVPDPSKDRAPKIAINGIVSGPGRVSAVTSTTSGTVYALNPTTIVFTASASNPGGVASLSLVVDEPAAPPQIPGGELYNVTATPDPGQVPDKLDVFTTAAPESAPIRIVMCDGPTCGFTEYNVTATATNFNGQTSTVTVHYTPLGAIDANLTANPTQITKGGSSTLKWDAGDAATTVTLDGVPVAPSGTKVVTPSSTTSYTLAMTNPLGSAHATATVTVTPQPPTSTPADLTLAYEFPGAGQVEFTETVTFAGTMTNAADPNDTSGATSFHTSASHTFPSPGGGTILESVPTTIPNLRKGTWRVSATGNGGFAGPVTCHGIVVPQAFGEAQLSVYDSSGPSCTCSPPCGVGP